MQNVNFKELLGRKYAPLLIVPVLLTVLFFTASVQVVSIRTHAVLGENPGRVLIHPSYVADFSDDNTLVGASHNVFVGKVIAVDGQEENYGIPGTKYTVEVIENIKGTLKKEVAVLQDGGYKDGVLYAIEDGGEPLKIGSTYVLATRDNTEKGWLRLNSHTNASKLLSEDARLSAQEALEIADRDVRVKELKIAYPREVLLKADEGHNNTKNSFARLSLEEKANAKARSEAAKN